MFFLVLLLNQMAMAAMRLQVDIYYPTDGLQKLSSGAIFQLVVCYLPGCPSNGWWNQTIPGTPYDPQWTIFETDVSSANPNLYTKFIDLNDFVGTVYMAIYAASDPAGDPFGNFSVVSYCDTSAIDPVSNDCVHVGMPYQSVQQTTTGDALIVAYPYFGFDQGKIYTIFKNMYSPEFKNYRDVNVYIPSSVRQNTVNRTVNVLVVNDGTLFYLNKLAYEGGFDQLVISGGVPETIMIGIPQNATGCDRQLELTFSKSQMNNLQ